MYLKEGAMSLFGGIFGHGYEQKNPEARLASIPRLTLVKKDVLENLAANDPDERVRAAAKARLEALMPKK
jgi:hypothetical protein